MNNKTEHMEENTKEVTPLKKSEILAEQKELNIAAEKLISEMQNREYEVDFKDKKVFNQLVKFLEKDAPWGHTTATGLIMLYHNIREQKELSNSKDWNGVAKFRAANVSILWQMLTKMSGKGFYEAKHFVELMAACGESLSKAVQAVHEDNSSLRETHQRLARLDDLVNDPSVINDIVEDEVETISLADQVDPIVEN